MVSRQYIIDILNSARFKRPNVEEALALVEEFCLERNTDKDKVSKFITSLCDPSMSVLLIECYKYVIEYYKVKFNICELIHNSQTIFYY